MASFYTNADFLVVCLLLFGIFFHGGLMDAGTACCAADIAVTTQKTGKVVEDAPEFQVTVSNNCDEPQSNVAVRCYGLNSYEPIDPDMIREIAGRQTCLIYDGHPIYRESPVTFKYAWIDAHDFPVLYTNSTC